MDGQVNEAESPRPGGATAQLSGSLSSGPAAWSRNSLTVRMLDWLVQEGRALPTAGDLIAHLCTRFCQEGVPLSRASLSLVNLHPELRATTFQWTSEDGAVEIPRLHASVETSGYLDSPLYPIFHGAAGFRRRLEGPDARTDYPILEELKAEGTTDYVVMEVVFQRGTRNAISWSTKRPGGFHTAELTCLYDILPHLAMLLEVHQVQRDAQTLLSVYLGADAGRRVLHGEVTRGSGQEIEAAILFSDMRGFTPLSEQSSPLEIIATLNQYFECVITPVEEAGGTVLKLIGDGLLAIFPLEQEEPGRACRNALGTASLIFSALEAINEERVAAGRVPIRIGLTFHVGTVVYGNIGGLRRLDFTVIGPAVNLVSRLQGLCRTLGKSVLFTRAFALRAGTALDYVGAHRLRGIAEPQDVFSLPE